MFNFCNVSLFFLSITDEEGAGAYKGCLDGGWVRHFN